MQIQHIITVTISIFSLSMTIRQIENLNLLKKTITKDAPMVPKYYCSGERKDFVYHARIRKKCRNLNVNLYYNIISAKQKHVVVVIYQKLHNTPLLNVEIISQKCVEIFSLFHCVRLEPLSVRIIINRPVVSVFICHSSAISPDVKGQKSA